ncbi:hypothetical protein [endosymbiont GvMRE of Glomus versiforme]|uniref:hypothetical protein n=1 Tax=endosymbiont GvMRE of Glomus versiforme TaxID=2039283 RepID=UPI000EDD555F|nr:hypothetical protein [endosymbiont GvMRE of Glomus versiforme]RHZ37286.1 hypothetical protein GvMRE_I1g296 [endosymbiont GvMRE of Glomus versiforme]
MSQAKIQVAIKNKDKSEEAFLHFQRIANYLRKKCRDKVYFIKKKQKKSNK